MICHHLSCWEISSTRWHMSPDFLRRCLAQAVSGNVDTSKSAGFFSRVWRHKKSRPVVLRTFELNRAQSHSAHFLWLLFDRFWFDFFILDVVNAMLCGREEAQWRLTPQESVQCCLPPVCAHGWLWYRGWGIEDVPEQGDASEMQLCSSCRFTRIVFVKLFSSSVNHQLIMCPTAVQQLHSRHTVD